MTMLKMCWNWKVLAGLGAVAVAIYLMAPNAILGILPILALLACPLSMVAMMWGMKGMGGMKSDQSTQLQSPAPQPGPASSAPATLSREEQLGLLRVQLQSLGDQQAALAHQVELLEMDHAPASHNGVVHEAEQVAQARTGTPTPR